METAAPWIGLAMTALGMILGGVVYVQAQLKADREKAEKRVADAKREVEDRHTLETARVEKLVDEERIERRRELNRMEETVKGFADVASAVIAMGKSLEHLNERHADSQRRTEAFLEELKQEVRTLASSRTLRVRSPRAKK